MTSSKSLPRTIMYMWTSCIDLLNTKTYIYIHRFNIILRPNMTHIIISNFKIYIKPYIIIKSTNFLLTMIIILKLL
jgi:hypothetical protein